MDTQCVVLLGHSLLLDGVAATLTGRPRLHLIRISADSDDPARLLRPYQPDLVIFEWDPARIHNFLVLLEEHPNLLLVGLHPEHSRLVVFGRQQPLATMQDLIAMLDDQFTQTAPAPDTPKVPLVNTHER